MRRLNRKEIEQRLAAGRANPGSWILGDAGSAEDEDQPEDDELALACRFGGHTFALDGAQPRPPKDVGAGVHGGRTPSPDGT